MNSTSLTKQLCEIRGIGRWTAEYVAMRALREPDAYPVGDLALLRALKLRNARELEERSEMWKPWRAYAAMYLWCVEPGGKSRRAGLGAKVGSVRRLRSVRETATDLSAAGD